MTQQIIYIIFTLIEPFRDPWCPVWKHLHLYIYIVYDHLTLRVLIFSLTLYFLIVMHNKHRGKFLVCANQFGNKPVSDSPLVY